MSESDFTVSKRWFHRRESESDIVSDSGFSAVRVSETDRGGFVRETKHEGETSELS